MLVSYFKRLTERPSLGGRYFLQIPQVEVENYRYFLSTTLFEYVFRYQLPQILSQEKTGFRKMQKVYKAHTLFLAFKKIMCRDKQNIHPLLGLSSWVGLTEYSPYCFPPFHVFFLPSISRNHLLSVQLQKYNEAIHVIKRTNY